MGSVSGTIREVTDYLCARGEKVGFLQIHLYRPFSIGHFQGAAGRREADSRADRCKEAAPGEPVYEDVCTAFTYRNET